MLTDKVVRLTRFQNLGYFRWGNDWSLAMRDRPGVWVPIGRWYRTKAELMGDLAHQAKFRGFKEA